jgi:hypothetical protein
MRGMNLIIPPICEPTVPLLGTYQLAGFAEQCGYPLKVCDYNNIFVKSIINYASSLCKSHSPSSIDNFLKLEQESVIKYLNLYPEISNYENLIFELKNCRSVLRYWELIDYVRACYDIFSFQFKNLRFRFEGLDCQYKWNDWADIETFVAEYSNSKIMDMINNWVSHFDFSGFDTVGLSITFESQLFLSILLCMAIRKVKPEIYIIIGGGFVNSFIDSFDSIGPIANFCNTVFANEGEAMIYFLSKTGSCRDLQKQGEGINPELANFVKASDICFCELQVTPPKFTHEQISQYLSPAKVISLRFSYQCYWGKCKFCTDKEIHTCLCKQYNIDKIIDYCIDNSIYGLIDCVYFLDSAISPSDIKKFCERIIASGINITWGTNLRFESVFSDEILVELMANAGCVFVKFGLESGSQNVLDLMQKGIKIETAAEIIRIFRSKGISVHTYVMAAYPGETAKDRELTSNFLLSDLSHPDNYNCSEFILYGTSAIAEELAYSFKNEQNKPGWHSSSYNFTNDDIQRFIQIMRERFDEKFSPNNIFISTGHTIALSRHLNTTTVHHNKLRKDSVIKLSNSIVFSYIDNIPVLARWMRHCGVVYIKGFLASLIFLKLSKPLPLMEIKKDDINLADILCLLSRGFIVILENGNGPYIDTDESPAIEMQFGGYFSNMKWYGYYDLN